MKKYAYLLALAFSLNTAFAATPLDASIAQLQHEWATANYQTPEKDREAALKKLSEQAHQVTAGNPGRAEPLIWEGIITSTLAKYQSLFSAGGTAKAARDLLLTAEKIDPNALDGSALTSLGSLYYKVPLAMKVLTTSAATQTFVGCYTLHLAQPALQATPPFQPLGIISGKFNQVANGTDVNALLPTACN